LAAQNDGYFAKDEVVMFGYNPFSIWGILYYMPGHAFQQLVVQSDEEKSRAAASHISRFNNIFQSSFLFII